MFLNMPMSSNNQRKDLTNASKRFKAMLSGLLHLMRYQEYEYIYIYIYIHWLQLPNNYIHLKIHIYIIYI